MPGVPKNLLIFTTDAQFGYLLRLSLEETGNYRVTLCYSPDEVPTQLAQAPFDLLIYDVDAAEPNYITVLHQVANDHPQLPLLVFPPDNDPNHPSLEQVNIWAFLNKPFYTPDLLHIVEALCRGERIIPPPPALPDAQETLQQFLVEFLNHSKAKAVWIFSAGRLFMEAGNLPSPFRDSLTAYLEEQWDALIDYGEWLRFATPPPPIKESPLLLYSRPLSAQALLVLFFPASTPLSQARREGASVNAALKDSPWLTTALLLAEAPQNVHEAKSETPKGETGESSQDWQTEWPEGNEEEIAINLGLLEQWLAEAPPPNPDSEMPSPEAGEGNWLLEETFVLEEHLVEPETPEISTGFVIETADTIDEPTLGTIEPASEMESRMKPEATSSPSSSEFATLLESAMQVPAPDETQPVPINEPPKTHGETMLVTIVLVPSIEESLQDAEIANELARWLPLRCARIGWNLKKMTLAATHALITLELPRTISLYWAVTLLRQQSSQRLSNRVNAFPASLAHEAFWSPHYLAFPGERLPDPEEIERLIAATRSQTDYGLD